MGCDIHLFIEKKAKKGWQMQTGFISDMYNSKDDYFKDKRFKNTPNPYSGRNYKLFGLLANVRNGYGFAGIDTGDAIKPISLPRGLPDDVSDDVLTQSEGWGIDGHSHSYLTFDELFNHDWEEGFVNRGYVTLDAFLKWQKDGKPFTDWCGGIGGAGVVTLTPAEALALHDREPGKDYFVNVQWKTKHKDTCRDFLKVMKAVIKKLKCKPSEARIVFWFDN